MPVAEPESVVDRSLTERARLRTLRHRRRRLWRRIVVFLAVMSVMVLMVLLSRDTQQLHAMENQGDLIAAALQEAFDQRGEAPLSFPRLPAPNNRLYDRYDFNIFYASEREGRPNVGVCCLKQPEQFFVLPNGRVVIVFDGQEYHSVWMPETEFRTRAERLGFGNLLKEPQR